MVSNKGTEAFKQLLHYITKPSAFFAKKDYDTGLHALGPKAKGILLMSEENRRMATTISQKFSMEFESVYRGSQVDLETILLQGDDIIMQSALLSHPSITGIGRGRYSFIITPGYTEAEIAHEVIRALGLRLVQLFCVPGAMEGQFLNPRPGLSGVYNTPMPAIEYADGLRSIRDDIKKVCIAYAPADQWQQQKAVEGQYLRVKKMLMSLGIEVVTHLWDFKNAYGRELRMQLKDCQVFITIDEPAVGKHRKLVKEVCEETRTLFCSSELTSVLEGAGVGMGITEDTYLYPMIPLLHDLLTMKNEVVPSFQIPAQEGIRYNLNALERQGVKLTALVRALLRMKAADDSSAIKLS